MRRLANWSGWVDTKFSASRVVGGGKVWAILRSYICASSVSSPR